MTMEAGYFNGLEYDEEFPRRRIAALVANGVYNGSMQVQAYQGMQIKITPGQTWINGYYGYTDDPVFLTLETASGILPRKDAVMLRLDLGAKKMELIVLTGVPSGVPAAPSVVRTETVHDLKLAEITVARGSTTVTQSMIRDTRLDTSQCGYTHGFDKIDTAGLMKELEAWASEYKDKISTDVDAWLKDIKIVANQSITEQQSAFAQWFDAKKSQVEGLVREAASIVLIGPDETIPPADRAAGTLYFQRSK